MKPWITHTLIGLLFSFILLLVTSQFNLTNFSLFDWNFYIATHNPHVAPTPSMFDDYVREWFILLVFLLVLCIISHSMIRKSLHLDTSPHTSTITPTSHWPTWVQQPLNSSEWDRDAIPLFLCTIILAVGIGLHLLLPLSIALHGYLEATSPMLGILASMWQRCCWLAFLCQFILVPLAYFHYESIGLTASSRWTSRLLETLVMLVMTVVVFQSMVLLIQHIFGLSASTNFTFSTSLVATVGSLVFLISGPYGLSCVLSDVAKWYTTPNVMGNLRDRIRALKIEEDALVVQLQREQKSPIKELDSAIKKEVLCSRCKSNSPEAIQARSPLDASMVALDSAASLAPDQPLKPTSVLLKRLSDFGQRLRALWQKPAATPRGRRISLPASPMNPIPTSNNNFLFTSPLRKRRSVSLGGQTSSHLSKMRSFENFPQSIFEDTLDLSLEADHGLASISNSSSISSIAGSNFSDQDMEYEIAQCDQCQQFVLVSENMSQTPFEIAESSQRNKQIVPYIPRKYELVGSLLEHNRLERVLQQVTNEKKKLIHDLQRSSVSMNSLFAASAIAVLLLWWHVLIRPLIRVCISDAMETTLRNWLSRQYALFGVIFFSFTTADTDIAVASDLILTIYLGVISLYGLINVFPLYLEGRREDKSYLSMSWITYLAPLQRLILRSAMVLIHGTTLPFVSLLLGYCSSDLEGMILPAYHPADNALSRWYTLFSTYIFNQNTPAQPEASFFVDYTAPMCAADDICGEGPFITSLTEGTLLLRQGFVVLFLIASSLPIYLRARRWINRRREVWALRYQQ